MMMVGTGNGKQSSAMGKKDQWVECPFNKEQLEKIFSLHKLKKTMTKISFLIDVGE